MAHSEILLANSKYNDGVGYDRLATNMLKSHVFSRSDSPPYSPDLFRTPVYPIFLASVYALIGHNPVAAIFVQILLNIAATYLIYWVGMKLFSRKAALLAAFLFAIDPLTITYCHYLLTETLATFLTLFGVVFLVNLNPGIGTYLASGIMLGLSALCRPIVSYLWAPLLFYFISLRNALTWKRIGLCFISFVLSMQVVLAPWLYRNWVSGKALTLSLISSANLFEYPAAGSMALAKGMEHWAAHGQLLEEVYRRSTDPIQQYRVMREIAFRVIKDYPLEVLILSIRGMKDELFYSDWPRMSEILWGQTYWEPSFSGILKSEGLGSALKILYSRGWLGLFHILTFLWELVVTLSIYVLAILGTRRGIRLAGHRRFVLLFLILSAYFLVLGSAAQTNARFRVPVMPYLCLLAGLGLKDK